MKKRAGQFETIPIAHALRSAMKHSNNKLEEFKSEPYATTVGPEDAVEADKRTDHRNRISAARRRDADALNATRR